MLHISFMAHAITANDRRQPTQKHCRSTASELTKCSADSRPARFRGQAPRLVAAGKVRRDVAGFLAMQEPALFPSLLKRGLHGHCLTITGAAWQRSWRIFQHNRSLIRTSSCRFRPPSKKKATWQYLRVIWPLTGRSQKSAA